MTAIGKRGIRKALEAPLAPILVANTCCVLPADPSQAAVRYENTVLDPITLGLEEWIRFTVHYGKPKVIEMGKTPRRYLTGFALCSIFTKLGSFPDRNDTIAGIVEAAYPYDATLTNGGVSVILQEVDPVDGSQDGVWWMSSLKINWQTWRYV